MNQHATAGGLRGLSTLKPLSKLPLQEKMGYLWVKKWANLCSSHKKIKVIDCSVSLQSENVYAHFAAAPVYDYTGPDNPKTRSTRVAKVKVPLQLYCLW